MATKERKVAIRRISSDDVLLALGAPFSFLDVIADLHLNGVGPEASGRALYEDWLVVGECMQDAMDEHERLIKHSGRIDREW